MTKAALLILASSFILRSWVTAVSNSCKCAPTDTCWPGNTEWDQLNATVAGQLIKTVPIAISCYSGPAYDVEACETVDESWTDPRFQALDPVGLSYPINVTCPPLNLTAGESGANSSCTIGTNPWYAVNATTTDMVAAAVNFAREKNVRLVIKDTGHDILGRSDGYGSLEVWIKYLRTGVNFTNEFKSGCEATNWTGAAISVGGGYTFDDVYPIAEANDVVVVGGGTPSVGVLGGWMQGGGHGPASREFGLGAEQVLSAQVVLANGSIVTASACENPDLFFAIRGGGPGTYGVVTQTAIKAWPMVNVSVQHLAIGPVSDNTTGLLDAVAILFEDFPDLNDAGYAGYGTWSINQPSPLFSTFYAGYTHGTYMFNRSVSQAQAAFQGTLERLLPYNTSSGGNLFISVSYVSYDNYWSFYHAESGVESPAGSAGVLASRLFSRSSVQNDTVGLRSMIEAIAGKPEQYTSNSVELVGGGAVFNADPLSGLNPAWRRSYFSNIAASGYTYESNDAEIEAVWAAVQAKGAAMKSQAPDTGAYMNEANRLDSEWTKDFYGAHYERLLEIKQAVDPCGVFYCPTCVGSAQWKVEDDRLGKLCMVGSKLEELAVAAA